MVCFVERKMYLSYKDATGQLSVAGEVERLGMLTELELSTDKKYEQLHAVNKLLVLLVCYSKLFRILMYFIFFHLQALTWRVCTSFFQSE